MRKRLLTGDRPTGPLHLGHYIGSLQQRVSLQQQYDSFIMIADLQALTDNFDNPHKITKNVLEVIKDYISVGVDPQYATIFIQSQVPQIAELTLYYMNLVSVSRLERNPTIKTEIQQKDFGASLPAGFLCYPINQAADITIFKAEIVPVGDDQVPMIEQTNEIVRKFNRLYQTDCLKECQATLSPHSRLVGIDGAAKASKSLGNAIFLSDSSETVREKVLQMYTDPQHIRVSDPGQVEGNVVFSYLDAFYDDKDDLKRLKNHYRQGGLGDMSLKKLLIGVLEGILQPMRQRRDALCDRQLQYILKEHSDKARETAEQTMREVRHSIGLSYF
jgi:tryptophanyl-tRNA synthetase